MFFAGRVLLGLGGLRKGKILIVQWDKTVRGGIGYLESALSTRLSGGSYNPIVRYPQLP